jgi:hypothetical protein
MEGVIPPNQLETIVVDLNGTTWKYTRYYQEESSLSDYISNTTMTDFMEDYSNVPDEFEMYDLTSDPIETQNLAGQGNAMEPELKALLAEQCEQKALTPQETGVAPDRG